MEDVKYDIYCYVGINILLEKCCVHVPCSLNNQNWWWTTDIYGALHNTYIGPVRACLLIAHHILQFAEWSDSSMFMLFLRNPETNFPVSRPSTHLKWKWADSVSYMQSEVATLWCTLSCTAYVVYMYARPWLPCGKWDHLLFCPLVNFCMYFWIHCACPAWWFEHSEYIKWTQQTMKLLTLQFSGACCCFVYLSFRY